MLHVPFWYSERKLWKFYVKIFFVEFSNNFYFQHILEFYLISELMIFELIEYINETAFRFTDNMVINI